VSEQGDAFVRRVLKADPAPMTFTESLSYLRQRGGSGRGAARLAGVSEATLRRWAAGTTPKQSNVQKIVQAARSVRTHPSKMGDQGVILPVVSADRKRGQRERDISGRQLRLQPGTLDRAQQAWVSTGDPDKALAAFIGGIGEPWYRSQLARGAGLESVVDDDVVLDSDYGMTIG